MKIVMFANGVIDCCDFSRQIAQNADCVIAVDGGAKHADRLDIIPNYLFGDFDSLDAILLAKYRAMAVSEINFPTQKDATDLELAVSFALTKSPSKLIILGGFGGRADHFLGNIHVLISAATAGICAALLDSTTCVQVISGYCEILREQYSQISLIPLTTHVTDVKTFGLQYPLCGETLQIGTTRGISNTFVAAVATISISDGLLLAICTK